MTSVDQPWARLIRGITREDFVSKHESTRILLVRFRAAQQELVEGLESSLSGTHKPPQSVLRYKTQVSGKELLQRAQLFDLFTPEMLAKELRKVGYFGLPVRKRGVGAKNFATRISIGRAANNDIVLRDESVSKFQAWLERDDNDAYYIGAGPSTNPTLLNGQRVGRETVSIEDGDRLHFGQIEALCVTAGTFFDGATLALSAPG